MPLTDDARNGLSVAPYNGRSRGGVITFDGYVTANPASGVPAGPSRDPGSTMQASRDSNSMKKIVVPKDDRPPYYFRMMVSKYNRESWLKVGELDPVLTIELPIPQSLLDAHNVLWQAEEIGAIGAAAMGFGQESVGGVRGLLQGAGAIARNLAGNAANALGTGLAQGIGARVGLAINNYLTMMLQGPAYKEHEFRWKISPNSASESEALVDLYREVNNAQAVGLQPNSFSAFFTYPMIFQLEFVHDEADMGKMLYRFKPCVLRASAWNFMPMGAAFYGESHAPESLEFSLKFAELEFWLTGDFK